MKEKYYLAFGVTYFLFHLENGRTMLTRREGTLWEEATTSEVEPKGLILFEIKSPDQKLIMEGEKLKQKFLEGSLGKYEDSYLYKSIKREQMEIGARMFAGFLELHKQGKSIWPL